MSAFSTLTSVVVDMAKDAVSAQKKKKKEEERKRAISKMVFRALSQG